MSLKAFHVVFITLSIVLCVWFGLWAFSQRGPDGSVQYLALSALAFLSSAGLLAYEVGFLRKCRVAGIK